MCFENKMAKKIFGPKGVRKKPGSKVFWEQNCEENIWTYEKKLQTGGTCEHRNEQQRVPRLIEYKVGEVMMSQQTSTVTYFTIIRMPVQQV